MIYCYLYKLAEMKNVIVAWVNHGDFESHVPLKFVGKRNLKLGFKNDITVLFLKGLDKLDSTYKTELVELGYQLVDTNNTYEKLCERYPNFKRFGDYERNCLLRWLVIQETFPNEPIIHYDGDIVFNECPSKISNWFAGTTFVLQGCPAFTCISDKRWFDIYTKELNLFHNQIEEYSKAAWHQREGWEGSKFFKWSGERHRSIISSDQDLISHLIHINMLPQSNPDTILGLVPNHILIQNPIVIEEHQKGLPFNYERRNGVDYLNQKQVLFWHMQSDFCYYLALCLIQKWFFFNLVKLRYNALKANKLLLYLYAASTKILPLKKRSFIYSNYFISNDFNIVFNKKIWWRKGVFQ